MSDNAGGLTFEKFHVVGGTERRPNFRIGRPRLLGEKVDFWAEIWLELVPLAEL